jgi:hypothetical protein
VCGWVVAAGGVGIGESAVAGQRCPVGRRGWGAVSYKTYPAPGARLKVGIEGRKGEMQRMLTPGSGGWGAV